MRKLLCLLAVFLLLCGAKAQAATGDVVGQLYTTDVLAYVDDIPIPCYAANGKTVICLEDLRAYGFSVTYDNSVRMLIVNKTGQSVEAPAPILNRGKEGELAGSIYATDIIAVVNGEQIPALAIDGKMVAAVEDLGAARYNGRMSYEYDASQRTLRLYTDRPREKEKGYRYWAELPGSEAAPYQIAANEDYAVFWFCTLYPHKSYGQLTAEISYRDGQSDVPLGTILKRYGVNTQNISVEGAAFELDHEQDRLLFHDLDHQESYVLDPHTFLMRKLRTRPQPGS